MASRADNIASNLSLANFSKATELKQRIWFTIGALVVFRFLSFVPLPGVNPLILGIALRSDPGRHPRPVQHVFGRQPRTHEPDRARRDAVHHRLNRGATCQLASPLTVALKKEGTTGRQKLNQYTRYGAVGLCAIQGWFVASGLESYGAQSGINAVVDPGLMFRVGAVISLVGGTMFLLWLGEQITCRGIGNGVSLIIMAGIVAQFPQFAANLFEGGRTGAISPRDHRLLDR